MKFPEPKTVWGATSPVMLTSWFFGMGVIEYPAGQSRPLISVCWSIVHLILFLSFMIPQNWVDLIPEKSTVAVGGYGIIIFFGSISVIMFLILGYTKSTDVAASLQMLNAVNNMLGKYGITKDYGVTFRSQIIQLIGGFLCISIMIIISVLCVDFQSHSRIAQLGYLATMNYLLISSFIVDNTFSNLIRYIGNRFQRLNEFLVHMSLNKNSIKPFLLHGLQLDGSLWSTTFDVYANSCSSRVTDKQSKAYLIWNSRKIHCELCSTAKRLNKAFGIQILLSMTMSFCLITFMLYNVYNMAVNWVTTSPSYSLITLCWLLFYIAKIFIIISVCTMTSTQAQRTGELLHHLFNPTSDSEVNYEIQTFSLQLLQTPLQFTASGFFTLDFTMVRGMAGVVTTYFVIMIQMRSIGEPEASSTKATTRAINATY